MLAGSLHRSQKKEKQLTSCKWREGQDAANSIRKFWMTNGLFLIIHSLEKADGILTETKKRIAAREIWLCSREGQGGVDVVV